MFLFDSTVSLKPCSWCGISLCSHFRAPRTAHKYVKKEQQPMIMHPNTAVPISALRVGGLVITYNMFVYILYQKHYIVNIRKLSSNSSRSCSRRSGSSSSRRRRRREGGKLVRVVGNFLSVSKNNSTYLIPNASSKYRNE